MKRLFWFIAQRYLSRAGQITSNHWRVYEDDLIGIPIKTFFARAHRERAVPCRVSEFIYTLIYSFSSFHSFRFFCFCTFHSPISRTLNKILIIFLFSLSLSLPLQILPCAIVRKKNQNHPVRYMNISLSSYVIIKRWVYAREITYNEHYLPFALAYTHNFFLLVGFRKQKAKSTEKTECNKPKESEE